MKKQMTLCIIHQHPRVLLSKKKIGFGEGKWNGFGGKVKPDEKLEDAAKREIKEEAGIEISDFDKHGILEFRFEDKPKEVLEVHILRAEDFSGEPTESEEMGMPQWFNIDEIPFTEMWPDDIHWFPLFLKKKKFTGRFLFAPDGSISDYELNEVQELF